MKKLVSLCLWIVACLAFSTSLVAAKANSNVLKFNVKGVTFEMVKVEGGKIGYVDVQTFYIGKTEVTQALWKAVMGNNPSNFKGDNNPVEMVSWEDCQDFIKRLNNFTGQQFRLPTRPEWSYAADGGNKSRNYDFSGSNDIYSVAWFGENSNHQTHPVAQKLPNELGLYDMSGNVQEWTSTIYDKYWPNDYSVEGGSWNWIKGGIYLIANSARAHKTHRKDHIGFRLALSEPVKKGASHATKPSHSVSAPSTATKPSTASKPTTIPAKSVTTPQKSSANSSGNVEKFTVNGVTFEMVKVDGGSFQMGSNKGLSDEMPVHRENIATFFIGKTEVTQALWKAVMGKNPSSVIEDCGPVTNVSWNDCQNFIKKLNQMTGKKFRLPTEAEWEYAARGGNRSQGYEYSGSNDINSVAWYVRNKKESKLYSVAQKSPNELGLYDMSGGVLEWCSDKYCSDYSSPRKKSEFVCRGGSMYDDARVCRVTNRGYSSPKTDLIFYGLRLALSY